MDSSSEDNCDLIGSPEPDKDAKTSSSSSREEPKCSQHLSSSTRQMRNLAEKMRRDKLNLHISELASIVPMVSTASKRIDKTSVLRLSAAYLRIYQNLLLKDQMVENEWKPVFLTSDLGGLLLEAVDGFLLIVSVSGKVIYVSEGIEKTLGHSPIDVLGHSVYNIVHQDDYVLMQKQLQSDNGNENHRRSFYCRMAERCLSRSECGRYDLVHIVGHLRSLEHIDNNNDDENSISVRENLLVALVRLLRNQPIREISWMAGRCDEYITHHMLDGRIICADHRISLITGHLPEEVNGKSAYQYIYAKDIPVASVAHKEIFTSSNGTSRTVYRLHTRGSNLVYLKTQGVLQYNSSTQKVESFLCINKLLREEDGKTELHQLRIRYSPCINHPSNCNGRCGFVDSEHEDHKQIPMPALQPLTEQTLNSVKQWCDISQLEPYLRTDSTILAKEDPECNNMPEEKPVGTSTCVTMTIYQEPVVSTSNQPFECTSPCAAINSPSSEGSQNFSSWSDCDLPRDHFETMSVVNKDSPVTDPSNGHHHVSSTSPSVRTAAQPRTPQLPALVSARSPSLDTYNLPAATRQKSSIKRTSNKRVFATATATLDRSNTSSANPSVCDYHYDHGISSSKACPTLPYDDPSSKRHRLQQAKLELEVKPVTVKRRRGRPRKRPASPENFKLC